MKHLIVSTAVLVVTITAAPHSRAEDLQPLVAVDVAHALAPAAGTPQIVEIWSLDCSYCRENVTRIAAWQKQHQDVRLTMIAMDPFDINVAALTRALATMRLPPQTVQYANAEAIPEKLRRAVDPEWRGELPRTMLIDTHGTRQAHSGLLPAGMLDAWRR
ncbi:TlpA family protein disulfide reductase [Paraburkholderia humisilvae]|uniref:TlpA family protein disulfide reductase n=1 Tax=Paraburkholderia humisilvae TaxID=627669 RepID=UPI001581D7D1|nr:TlpA family protein disulfide reductase [Paraburkholderia humisilvae]